MIARKVSQPTVRIHEIAAEIRFPLKPKAARERTSVGAEPRLPAMAMRPHTTKESATPTTDTMIAWVRESPKPRTHEPHEMPRTEIFAANHGMNRSEGFPLRSDSGMTSRPAISTARAPDDWGSLTVCSYATEILSERRNPITQVTQLGSHNGIRQAPDPLDLDLDSVASLNEACTRRRARGDHVAG